MYYIYMLWYLYIHMKILCVFIYLLDEGDIVWLHFLNVDPLSPEEAKI